MNHLKTPLYTRISIVVASALALAWVVWAPDVMRVAREGVAAVPIIGQLASVILVHNPKTADGIRSRYSGALAYQDPTVLRVEVVASSTASAASSTELAGSSSASDVLLPDDAPINISDLNFDQVTPALATASTTSLIEAPKVRILIVPGHEPTYGGAEYRALKERDLTLKLSLDLQALLAKDPRYEVVMTRDAHGWTPTFAAYFKKNWKSIIAWQKAAKVEEKARAKRQLLAHVGSSTDEVQTVFHNDAAPNVALRLYGITKWANENDIDIVIHVHLNDDPMRSGSKPGAYSGFAVYVPAAKYANASSSRIVGSAVSAELKRYEPVSTLPGESAGIVGDPDLIAIGANNTANAATMLIEYAYIYEPGLTDASKRENTLQNMALYTYYGIQDFFNTAPGSAPQVTP